jgi:hypothetical protein
MSVVIPQVGERYVGENPQVPKIYRATVGAVAGSDVLLDEQETVNVFSFAATAFVLFVQVKITTTWTASVTLTVGDGDDLDGFLTNALIGPQTDDDTLGVGAISLGMGTAYDKGKFYAAADTIDMVAAGATPAAGVAEVYACVWHPSLAV